MTEIKRDSISPLESRAIRRIYDEKHRDLELTQVKLGRLYGIEPPTVSNYLNGKIPLNLEFAVFFASQFGVELNEFSPRLAEKYNELISYRISSPIPIISKDELHLFLKKPFPVKETLTAHIKCSTSSFWYKLFDDENNAKQYGFSSPTYLLILIDPTQVAQNSEYALFDGNQVTFAKMTKHNELTPIGKVLCAQYPDSIF